MSKKIFCLVLVMMMLACSTAFAAIPSKTTANTIISHAPQAAEGVVLPPAFTINVTEDAKGIAQKALDAIAAFLTASDAPVVDAFGEETKEAVAALLPEGIEADALELTELFPLNIANYDAACGDVKVAFNTLTAANTAVAVLGIVSDEETAWLPLAAEVEEAEDGPAVIVTFPAEVLTQASGAQTVLAFLNTPEAEAE